MAENERGPCKFHKIFGDCSKGSNCPLSHDGTPDKQRFFLATIRSKIQDSGTIVQVQEYGAHKNQPYYVARGPWYTAGAVNGNLVLFQAPECISTIQAPYGRVAVNFGKGSGNNSSIKIQASHVEVFTIDEKEAKRHESHDDAFSIRKCTQPEHGDCSRIGIHISAAALGSLPITTESMPWYASKWRPEQYKIARFSLDEGKVTIALSVYVHTTCNVTEEPEFTVVKVMNNHAHQNFEAFERELDILWSKFAKTSTGADLLNNERMLQYRGRYPEVWRTYYIIEEMMTTFQLIIQKHIQHRCFVMGVCIHRPDFPEKKSVIVSRETYNNAKLNHAFCDILGILAVGAQFARDEYLEEDYSKAKYLKDVVETPSGNYLLCTSPLREFEHHVNQQILIHQMISGTQLYEKEKLLEIIGIRFHKPKLVQTTVKKLWNDWFKLDYIDTTIYDSALTKVPFTTFNHFEPVMTDKVEIKLKNCGTEQYCNYDILRLEGQAYRNFREKLAVCMAAKVSFEEMDRGKSEETLPYRPDGNDTVMTLETGVTLHLQISNWDAGEKTGLGLRLLRIGTNCHLCLTHINNPELAFMSYRKDVRELVDSEGIAALRKVRGSRREVCDSIVPKFYQVEWKGTKGRENHEIYYSGGIFTTDEKVVRGDLLCIRTDVVEKNGTSVEYVWCCHAVISEVNNAEVSFSVCTLSQTDKPPVDSKFCVEIIRFKNNKTKNPRM